MADGEDGAIDERLVAAHVARCPDCQSYEQLIHRSPNLAVACEPAAIPDLSKKISKFNAAVDRAAHWSILRVALAAVAAQVILFALPALILGEEHGVETHAARHLGAFGVAYGVALFVVVVRPARARSILPVALVLAGAQLLGAIVDLATGRIPLVGEARHLPQVISVFLIWFLAVPSTSRSARTAQISGTTRAAAPCAIGSSSSRTHPGR